jgi:hypothetical protein
MNSTVNDMTGNQMAPDDMDAQKHAQSLFDDLLEQWVVFRGATHRPAVRSDELNRPLADRAAPSKHR